MIGNTQNPLSSISPIDGRYGGTTAPLSTIFSEWGFMRYRIIVEGEYLIALSESRGVNLREFTKKEKELIRSLYHLKPSQATIISQIEKKGYKGIKATNHDFKAIEYYIKDKLRKTSLKDVIEFVHFGLTTWDTTNIAHALAISDSLEKVLLPEIVKVKSEIEKLARTYSKIPMLARTHGQGASPTTFGKEMKVFSTRIEKQVAGLRSIRLEAKLNGATGNYNALCVAYPRVNWPTFSNKFIKSFNIGRSQKLKMNEVTTQIECYDSYVAVFDTLRRINTILINFNQDMWRYISDGWVGQKPKHGEVGSSTMPHKINPWFLENSEGNLGMANTMFEFFARKLPISRLQRDLSDSTVLRSMGTAFAHSLIGFSYLNNQLGRIVVDRKMMLDNLNAHPEVITEAIQTILRREGIDKSYEKLKGLSRGKSLTMAEIHAYIDSLEISKKVKLELKRITPENYTGLASRIAI